MSSNAPGPRRGRPSSGGRGRNNQNARRSNAGRGRQPPSQRMDVAERTVNHRRSHPNHHSNTGSTVIGDKTSCLRDEVSDLLIYCGNMGERSWKWVLESMWDVSDGAGITVDLSASLSSTDVLTFPLRNFVQRMS